MTQVLTGLLRAELNEKAKTYNFYKYDSATGNLVKVNNDDLYANYWIKDKHFDVLPANFIKDCRTVIKNSWIPVSLVEVSKKHISLNGHWADARDQFVFKAEYHQPSISNMIPYYNFCITGKRPYDAVVKSILMLALSYGLIKEWYFDGQETDVEYKNMMDVLLRLKLI
ncbi:MAG: hypothetical protein FWG80_01830 [Alphaproteobacteria bacterium]|nr:hypothetical protein [Alphaproteobacteria bacterium]